MAEKYIRVNKKACNIVKNSKIYAKIPKLDEAIVTRDILVEYSWNLNEIPEVIEYGDNYLIYRVIEDRLCLLAKYKTRPSPQTIDKLAKKYKRNPNNSKYGLNITMVFGTFVVKKRIAGDDYIFGYYDNLEDAEFARNFLMDHMWNVQEFEDINYCDETDRYKVVKVIDDKAYVLGSFKSDEIDLNEVYGEFLAKISKHKYGLASHPHLDLLKDDVGRLEEEWGVAVADDAWSFDDVGSDALTDIVFTMNPFEKSVYDSIDGETSLGDIKKALIRYRSKNFENKIIKNLDGLIDKGLVEKVGDNYHKT